MTENRERINTRFERIPIEQFYVAEDLLDYEKPSIVPLKESIKTFGLLQPLTVVDPFGKKDLYVILDGRERYRAVENINKESESEIKELPCYVLDIPGIKSEKELINSKLLIYEQWVKDKVTNSCKKTYKRFFELRALYEMAKRKMIKRSEITGIFQASQGISERTARNYNTVFRSGSAELMKAVISDGSDHIPIDKAASVATFSGEEQKDIVARVRQGEKVDLILDEKKGK